MFHNQRSDLSKEVLSCSVVWRRLGYIRLKAAAKGLFAGLAIAPFFVFTMYLLLADPSGAFFEKAYGGTNEFVSDGNAPGATAQAIARFDVVPYQVFHDNFEIGVIAFHYNGIQRVEFEYETHSGVQSVDKTVMSLNSRTGVCEYWTSLNATDFEDGLVAVKATVYPNNGIERELTLELYADSGKTLRRKKALHVSLDGSDESGEGSQARPFRSIRRALIAVGENVSRYDGSEIILMDPGLYDLKGPGLSAENNMWITIHPDKSLHRDEVVIAPQIRENIRTQIRRLRFSNLTFDFSKVGLIYKEDTHWHWYDNCHWYQSEGPNILYEGQYWPVRNVGFNGFYVTDSVAEDMLYGFTFCNLVRDSHCRNITGDVFQMSRMVVNCTVDEVDGTALEHHTDLFQWWRSNENIIVYGVKATNIAGAQNLFLGGGTGVPYVDIAVVNVAVQNTQDRSEPPFTQFQGGQKHALFMHVANPGQKSYFREDAEPPYTAQDVKFVNCIFETLSLARWGAKGLPDGVSVESCHFVRGDLHGTRPSAGDISVVDGPASSFSYEGPGVADIMGTGTDIPGFSHPNDGTVEHGAPSRGAFQFEVIEEEVE